MSRYIRLFIVLVSIILFVVPMHTQELTPDALADLINRQVATTSNRVNVRAEAVASSELLVELKSNSEVQVVAVVETDSTQYPIWYEIVLEDGGTGFAWSELFSELETVAPIVVDSPDSFSVDWVILDSMISGIEVLVVDSGEDVTKNLLLNYAEELLNGEILIVDNVVFNQARERYNMETNVWEYDPLIATQMLDVDEVLYLELFGDNPVVVTQIIEDETGNIRVIFAQPTKDTLNDGRTYQTGQLFWNLTGDEFQHVFDLMWANTYSDFVKNFPDATTIDGQTYQEVLGISENISAEEIEIALRLMRETGVEWPWLPDYRSKWINPNLPIIMATIPAAQGHLWGAGRIYPIVQGTDRLVGGYHVDDYGQIHLLGLVDDNFQIKYRTLTIYFGNLLYLSMEISTGQRPIYNAQTPEWSDAFYERLGLDLVSLRTNSVSYR